MTPSDLPSFVTPVDPFGGAPVQTFSSWQEAFGMTDAQWREHMDELNERLAEIARARAEGMRHAHEVWLT